MNQYSQDIKPLTSFEFMAGNEKIKWFLAPVRIMTVI